MLVVSKGRLERWRGRRDPLSAGCGRCVREVLVIVLDGVSRARHTALLRLLVLRRVGSRGGLMGEGAIPEGRAKAVPTPRMMVAESR